MNRTLKILHVLFSFTHEYTSCCATSAFSAPALQGVVMVTGRAHSCAAESVQDDSSAFIHWANNIKDHPADWNLVCWALRGVIAGMNAKKETLRRKVLGSRLLYQEPHDWVRMTPVLKVSIGLPSAISKCWEKVRVAKQIRPAFVARLLPLTWPSNKARSD